MHGQVFNRKFSFCQNSLKGLFLILWVFACSPEKLEWNSELEEIPLAYASGFALYIGEGYKVIEVKKAFAGEHDPFRYLVLDQEDQTIGIDHSAFDGIVKLPISKVVMTSTTQVPHLDYLDASSLLIGFPNTDLISSSSIRRLIDQGKVRDLGSGPQANIEQMIDLEPDWVMISSMGDDLKSLDILKKGNIPALLNGEYMELHPLGRAEWIKFTGVLLGKLEEATSAFEEIKSAYLEAENLALAQKSESPKVMAGIMYQDIWYVPGADSWGAQLLKAAGGDYLFKDQSGTGSVQLSYETVLDVAEGADVWFGPSDFPSLEKLKSSDPRYSYFKPFQRGEVYSYSLKIGPTGGLEYFELGYLRPDLILKDLIKILHPEQLPDYDLYFYRKLDEK